MIPLPIRSAHKKSELRPAPSTLSVAKQKM